MTAQVTVLPSKQDFRSKGMTRFEAAMRSGISLNYDTAAQLLFVQGPVVVGRSQENTPA